MDFKSTTKKSIEETFNQFDKDNPEIYQHFVFFALQWIKSGAKKISSKQVIGRIRWFLDVETKGEAARTWKINDITTAYYSRKFIQEYPEHETKFEFRRLRS
jgi:hypothetical protein